MGVPHLFRYFARRWPEVVKILPVVNGSPALPDAEHGRGIHVHVRDLYIDFNSVVHMCARAIFGGETPGSEAEVVRASVRHLEHIVAVLQPTALVYVAVDGVPPRAKMVQQRSRRFVAVRHADRIRGWDTNAITPGTQFMKDMVDALKAWASETPNVSVSASASASVSASVTVTVSGDGEDGEGEQKIFQHIRGGGSDSGSGGISGISGIIAIYSLDADILLMALTLPGHLRGRVRVVREKDLRGAMQMVSITCLARNVLSCLRAAIGPSADPISDDARLADYVAALGMLGNDFIPPLPGLRICDGAVDTIVRLYGSAVAALPGRCLSRSGPDLLGGLDLEVLSLMVAALADDEPAAVDRAERQLSFASQRVRRAAPTLTADVVTVLHDSHPVAACNLASFGTTTCPGWRVKYYEHVFGAYSPDIAQQVAEAYILSLAWSAAYMRQRCLSRGWHFAYTHAPTALDLHNALRSRSALALAAAAEEAYRDADRAHAAARGVVDGATWQLVLVLPPQSAHLIPHAPARLVVAGHVPAAAYMYPIGFRMATYGREHLHECAPMLPGLDSDVLLDALVESGEESRVA